MFEKTKGNKMQQWGSNPTLYAPVDFFGKKFMDRPYVCIYIYIYIYIYFFLFFLFYFFSETSMKTSRYLVNSFSYNPGTSQNDFWIKETDKRAKNGDKKRPKTL
jgi:hypothetical protein